MCQLKRERRLDAKDVAPQVKADTVLVTCHIRFRRIPPAAMRRTSPDATGERPRLLAGFPLVIWASWIMAIREGVGRRQLATVWRRPDWH